MNTTAPNYEAIEMSFSELSSKTEFRSENKIEIPIQQMFDEFMVFISKTDFD